MSGRTVSFSFDTSAEKQEWELFAKKRGMTLPGLAKMALFQYAVKNHAGRLKKAQISTIDTERLSTHGNS